MKRLLRSPLGREIVLILAVKFALMFALWFAFFRHPIDKGLDAAAVSRVLLGGESSAIQESTRSSP